MIYSAEDAEYARQWVEQDEHIAGKYLVEEKRARVRLAYDVLSEVKEFFAIKGRCLPLAGFTAEDFRPGELVCHERGKNLCLSLPWIGLL